MRAVEVLHDQPFMGRKLTVSGAKSKGHDEREDQEERTERAPRPVVVASSAPGSVAPVTHSEPVIETIVETVPTAHAEIAPVAEAESSHEGKEKIEEA